MIIYTWNAELIRKTIKISRLLTRMFDAKFRIYPKIIFPRHSFDLYYVSYISNFKSKKIFLFSFLSINMIFIYLFCLLRLLLVIIIRYVRSIIYRKSSHFILHGYRLSKDFLRLFMSLCTYCKIRGFFSIKYHKKVDLKIFFSCFVKICLAVFSVYVNEVTVESVMLEFKMKMKIRQKYLNI